MTADERALETRLLALLTMVNDWLKYAETKNSLVVGLASAGIVGSIATLPNAMKDSVRFDAALLVMACGEAALIASAALSLVSFLPKTELGDWVSRRQGQPTPNDNFYYYGHLAKYPPEHLARTLMRRWGHRDRDTPPSEAAIDIAEQIVSNSRITLWKLRLFVPALLAFVVGVLFLAAAMAVALSELKPELPTPSVLAPCCSHSVW